MHCHGQPGAESGDSTCGSLAREHAGIAIAEAVGQAVHEGAREHISGTIGIDCLDRADFHLDACLTVQNDSAPGAARDDETLGKRFQGCGRCLESVRCGKDQGFLFIAEENIDTVAENVTRVEAAA